VAGRTQPVQEDLTDGAASARDQDRHNAPITCWLSRDCRSVNQPVLVQ
jgi:hypothetical protein